MNRKSDKKLILYFLLFSVYIYIFYYFISNKTNISSYAYLFFSPSDRFADFNKIIFSFSHIFDKSSLISLNVPSEFIINNPYTLIRENNTTLLMASPPLMFVFFLISSYVAKFIGINYMILFICYFFLYFVAVLYFFKNEIKENIFVLSLIFSFPMLYLIDRGNIVAALTTFFLFLTINKFLENKNLTNLDIILFVLATSFRPNYLIFGLIFIFNEKIKESIKIILKIAGLFFSFNSFLIFISSKLLPGYSFEKFIFAFREYAFVHDGLSNISAYGAFKNIYNFFVFNNLGNFNSGNFLKIFNSEILIFWILSFYLLLIIFNHSISYKLKEQKLRYILVITTGCFLFTHPVAVYHLILLSFILISNLKNIQIYEVKLDVIIILLILLPKIYVYPPLFNFASFINFLLLNYLFFKNILFLYKSRKLINSNNILESEKIYRKSLTNELLNYVVHFLQILREKNFGKKLISIVKLFTFGILFGIFASFIYINFVEETPIQLRKLENACGEFPENYIKPDISNNPNFVFVVDSSYQSKVLWDEFSNVVNVNSFIECEHYFTGGWNYFSKDFYLENQEKSCLKLDKLIDTKLDSGVVYLKNIGLKEFFVDKNSLCIGSIQNLSVDGNTTYFEVQYSRAAYIFISQIVPIIFMVYFLKLNWFRYVIFLILFQIVSQLIFNFYIGLNMFNSVSIFSSLALLIFKLKDKNELKI